MKTAAVLLAAGRANHMHDTRLKEMHKLMGRTLLEHVLDNTASLVDETVVVVGDDAEAIEHVLPEGVRIAVQDYTPGAGAMNSVLAGLRCLSPEVDRILVAASDMPALSQGNYRRLIDAVDGEKFHAAVLYADVEDPTGCDRIIFGGDGDVRRICRKKQVGPFEEGIHSVNVSVYCFTRAALERGQAVVRFDGLGETHLSRMIETLSAAGRTVAAVEIEDPREAVRVISQQDMATVFRFMNDRACQKHMNAGVTIIDPRNTYIEPTVVIGPDTVIFPGCYLQGATVIGEGCRIRPHCRLKDTVVGDGAIIEASVLVGDTVPAGAFIPPFTYHE